MDEEKERVSWKQVEKSFLRLDKLSSDGSELVSNVRVAEDAREVQCRKQQEEARNARSVSHYTIETSAAHLTLLSNKILWLAIHIYQVICDLESIAAWISNVTHQVSTTFYHTAYTVCRYEKLEAEATAGEERFEEIVKKWSTAKNRTIPQVCVMLYRFKLIIFSTAARKYDVMLQNCRRYKS